MNMVMTNQFGHNFERKLYERRTIEHALEKEASMQQKNLKHNIYLTKAQRLRNEVSKNNLDRMFLEDIENAYLEKHRIPKMMSSSLLKQDKPTPRSMSTKDIHETGETRLPPIKRQGEDQENEIRQLIKKNLIFDKPKQRKSIKAPIRVTDENQQPAEKEVPGPVKATQELPEAPLSETTRHERLFPTNPAAKAMNETAQTSVSRPDMKATRASLAERKQKNNMLNDYFNNKKAMK